MLAAARNLKVVARAGVGLDNVDVKAATQAGVMVVNAPQSNIVSAAELAVGLLLAAARHIAPANAALKQGEWKRSKYTGVELYEKTAGIVGPRPDRCPRRPAAVGVRHDTSSPTTRSSPPAARRRWACAWSRSTSCCAERRRLGAPAEDARDGRASSAPSSSPPSSPR